MKYLGLVLFIGCAANTTVSYPSKPPINGDIVVEQVLASTPMLVNTNSGNICTSIAISPNILLTARHCIIDLHDPGQLFFTNINHEVHTAINVYPDSTHDIAAIRVVPPMAKWITAEISDPLATFPGEPVSTFGYGCSKINALTEHTDIVEQPHLPIGDGNFDYILLKGHACKGDSGGPVIRQSGKVMGVTITVDSTGTLVGVTPVWVDGASSWPGLSSLL